MGARAWSRVRPGFMHWPQLYALTFCVSCQSEPVVEGFLLDASCARMHAVTSESFGVDAGREEVNHESLYR